jgi:hypothetical protein
VVNLTVVTVPLVEVELHQVLAEHILAAAAAVHSMVM